MGEREIRAGGGTVVTYIFCRSAPFVRLRSCFFWKQVSNRGEQIGENAFFVFGSLPKRWSEVIEIVAIMKLSEIFESHPPPYCLLPPDPPSPLQPSPTHYYFLLLEFEMRKSF